MATTCVPAVSVIVTVPCKEPVVVGMKRMLMLQFAPAAIEPEQLVVSVKSVLGATEVMLIGIVPVLVKITVCASEEVPTNCPPYDSCAMSSEAPGARPFPIRETVNISRLLVTASSPDSVPAIFGAYAMLMMQLAPGARMAAQVLVWVKSPSVETAIPVMASVPLFVSTTFSGGLLAPTSVLGKVCALGVNTAPAGVPVADRLMT